MSEKMMRVSDAIIEELDALSSQYDVNRKMLLQAAVIVLRFIMENDAKSIGVACADGEIKNIPTPLVFKNKNKVKE